MPAALTAILCGPHPGTPIEGDLIAAAGTADRGPACETACTLAFHFSTGTPRR
jgi:hypothetical protein